MGVVACRVQEVRLAQSGLAPDEQGVVGPRRRLGNRQSRGLTAYGLLAFALMLAVMGLGFALAARWPLRTLLAQSPAQ